MTQSGPRNTNNFILGILVMLAVLVVLYYVAKFVFTILWWIAPVLLVLTLILNHRIVTGYIGWIANVFKRNWGLGLVLALLSIVGFPVVSLLLFGRAFLQRRMREQAYEEEVQPGLGEYIDFEDLPEEPRPRTRIEERHRRDS